MILDDIYGFLKGNYKQHVENLKIDEVCSGPYLTAVRLTDGSYGVASTLLGNHHHCTKQNRDFGDFTPLNIREQTVTSLFETAKSSNTIDTLRIAVMNAISSTILSGGKYRIIEDRDPIELIDLSGSMTITIVGAFHSYIEAVSATHNRLYVLELNRNALTRESMKYFIPAEDYATVIPESDVVIITGMTLVNNTIDGLLSVIRPEAKVIVTGPSSSIIPDVLFENKVNIIGATKIEKPELLFQIIREFGTGYHLFRYCARKTCIINEQPQA
ncbi:MAG: DUF364 domain-containing protein [Bacteroidales bacterium]|nr:DUF364 domain-containing protein [Bacteroidales bacterium]